MLDKNYDYNYELESLIFCDYEKTRSNCDTTRGFAFHPAQSVVTIYITSLNNTVLLHNFCICFHRLHYLKQLRRFFKSIMLVLALLTLQAILATGLDSIETYSQESSEESDSLEEYSVNIG